MNNVRWVDVATGHHLEGTVLGCYFDSGSGHAMLIVGERYNCKIYNIISTDASFCKP